jgi:hypothetical protein
MINNTKIINHFFALGSKLSHTFIPSYESRMFSLSMIREFSNYENGLPSIHTSKNYSHKVIDSYQQTFLLKFQNFLSFKKINKNLTNSCFQIFSKLFWTYKFMRIFHMIFISIQQIFYL